jgi:hypothetical protein
VRHRVVNEERPKHHEQQHRAELHALGERAGNQARRDDRKHQLIDHESLRRDRCRIVRVGSRTHSAQEEVMESAYKARARTERQAVAHQSPQHGDNGHHGKALHHGGEHVLLANESAIEKGQSGTRHHENQSGTREHPGVVGRTFRVGYLLLEFHEPGFV